jgi:hypothetical protein
MRDIKSDLEYYCYLKWHLPEGFTITSEPSTAYYSEWKFHYTIRKGSLVVDDMHGDFQTLDQGSLVRHAQHLIKTIGNRYDHRN